MTFIAIINIRSTMPALNDDFINLCDRICRPVAWYSEAPWYFVALVKLTMDIQLAWYSEATPTCDHDAIIYIVLI